MNALTFQDNSIRTNGNLVCLTDMAKPYGKLVKDWTTLDSTQAYLKALNTEEGGIPLSPILVVSHGKPSFGSPEVAIAFAQWLSPEFHVWCIRHLRTLMETGSTSLAKQEHERVRLLGKTTRLKLTDSIKFWLDKHPEASENTKRFIYSNCSDCLNKFILGHKAKAAKEVLGLSKDSLLRDAIPADALVELDAVERIAGILIVDFDINPLDAVKQAITESRARFIGLEMQLLAA